MIKLIDILKEEQTYDLVKNDEEYGEYVDTEMYKKILVAKLEEKGIKLKEEQWEEFEEELGHAGFTGEEYRNVTPSDLVNDYFLYINNR